MVMRAATLPAGNSVIWTSGFTPIPYRVLRALINTSSNSGLALTGQCSADVRHFYDHAGVIVFTQRIEAEEQVERDQRGLAFDELAVIPPAMVEQAIFCATRQ